MEMAGMEVEEDSSQCRGHSSRIHHISFSSPSNPQILHSCSSDGTIRAWDTRTFTQVSLINAGQAVFSFSFGGPGDNLLAAGCNSQILFWDWRNKKQVACLEESHTQDVTQVQFVPDHQNKLVSASEDGLVCIFDTSGDINDDDHLESVINMETSVNKFGFFGEANQKLWCLTHIETLSIWDWEGPRKEVHFQDARSFASNSWSLDHVDYFADCHYSRENDRLWVIGGTYSGTLGFFPVSYSGMGSIGAPEAVLGGGHTGVVRSILPLSEIHSGTSRNHGIFGWTGGEDGRLCCWSSDQFSGTNHSWISSELVVKSSRTRIKNRHHPY
ncbi:WD40 repeat [Dillenia turbinata]|uniref:WD40 repeat n=1 Tax=Dillenia turbinata TaxID=194707 RepID=A0AAN8W434_9MAGN